MADTVTAFTIIVRRSFGSTDVAVGAAAAGVGMFFFSVAVERPSQRAWLDTEYPLQYTDEPRYC
jgi:hypothetical protein